MPKGIPRSGKRKMNKTGRRGRPPGRPKQYVNTARAVKKRAVTRGRPKGSGTKQASELQNEVSSLTKAVNRMATFVAQVQRAAFLDQFRQQYQATEGTEREVTAKMFLEMFPTTAEVLRLTEDYLNHIIGKEPVEEAAPEVEPEPEVTKASVEETVTKEPENSFAEFIPPVKPAQHVQHTQPVQPVAVQQPVQPVQQQPVQPEQVQRVAPKIENFGNSVLDNDPLDPLNFRL